MWWFHYWIIAVGGIFFFFFKVSFVIYYSTNQHSEMGSLIAGTTFMPLATNYNPSITKGHATSPPPPLIKTPYSFFVFFNLQWKLMGYSTGAMIEWRAQSPPPCLGERSATVETTITLRSRFAKSVGNQTYPQQFDKITD